MIRYNLDTQKNNSVTKKTTKHLKKTNRRYLNKKKL